MRQDFPSASSFELHGFGDVQYYQFLNSDDANEHGAFSLGQLDLYVVESIGSRLDVLTEVAIESPDGAEFVVDLERITCWQSCRRTNPSYDPYRYPLF